MRDTAEVLAGAFFADPMFTFIEPDDLRRRSRLRWFFAAALRMGRQHGRVDVDPDGRGAAIWLTPGRTSMGLPALVRSGMAVAPLRLGIPAFRRFARLTAAFEETGQDVHGEHYWHLLILGVDPRFQGRGVGARLIEPVLAEASAAGQLCYLETCAQRNVPFYASRGFGVARHLKVAGLPESWLMVRPGSS